MYVLPHPTTLVWTFATLVIGEAIYAALLLTIDNDARMLVRSILHKIGIEPTTTDSSHEVGQTPKKCVVLRASKSLDCKLADVRKQIFRAKAI